MGGRQTLDVITVHRLKMLDLEPSALNDGSMARCIQAIYTAFLERIPYENLSNNRSVADNPTDPDDWPRATDRLLRENAALGLGGTSFSLAYTLRDLFRGAGATAHCTLGYNLVTEQAHAAVVVYLDEGPFLYDPSLLMCGPIPVRPGGALEDPLGRFSLVPRCGPTLTVTLQMEKDWGPRPLASGVWDMSEAFVDDERPIYSIIPVPAAPQNFRQAWIASFYRGRPMPLRLARRVGDRIYRYGERPDSLELLSPSGRKDVPMSDDRAKCLSEVFGIDEQCLRAWFDG